MGTVDQYKDAIRALSARRAGQAPGGNAFERIRSQRAIQQGDLSELERLRSGAEQETALARAGVGVQQQDFLEDANRTQSLAAQQNEAFVNRGMAPGFRRVQEATRPLAKDTAFLAQQKGFGLNTNFGNPQIMGSGDTIGQGATGLGSTDVANAATEAASPMGQARTAQLLDYLRRARIAL